MKKYLRIPSFIVNFDFPDKGKVVISAPDDDTTYYNISREDADNVNEWFELCNETCINLLIQKTYPDNTFEENTTWWLPLVGDVQKLYEILNFNVPCNGTVASIISKGEYKEVNPDNCIEFLEKYSEDNDLI